MGEINGRDPGNIGGGKLRLMMGLVPEYCASKTQLKITS